MKLKAELNDEIRDVEIVHDGDKVTATVDGRVYHLEVSEPEPNVWLFKNEGRIFEASVLSAANGRTAVRIRDNEFDIKIIDPKRLRGSENLAAAGEGSSEIKTAMPGKVVRILVEVGDEVSLGDGVIVVEAMKMQNELKSPRNGVIKEIRAAEGDTVNGGDILVKIE